MDDDNEIKLYKNAPRVKGKTLFKALCFARVLYKDGFERGLAIYKSAKYYKVSVKDVAREMGRLGSHVREERRKYE
jgi:hypothetical protein